MYLKSIEVHGFKSFANKIKFEFHNGITCIVGPNGSGKSNVADAVRWVLGEQSAKQLRGSSMQDVIFSGTENRKPQGFAYVAITLDNSDHQLNIDYEEVTVARRVYRSGESEYLLNGHTCRLKDVNELFYDTGIGKEGYSIIGQGQIEQILSSKPEDRRELFDEAAGIVKFKRRKNIALKKLDDERANMVRVYDILSELEKQVGPLEKQSEAARKFLKLKEELKLYDVHAYLLDREKTTGSLKELEEKIQIVGEDLEDATQKSNQLKAQYESVESQAERLEQSLEERRSLLNNQNVQMGKLQGQINVLHEQINTERMNEEHITNRTEAIRKEITERNEKKAQTQKEREETDRKQKECEVAREQARQELEELEKTIGQYRQSVEESKGKIIQLLNEKSSFVAKQQRVSTMLEQNQIRKAELNQKLVKNKTEAETNKQVVTHYKQEWEQLEAEIEERKEALRLQEEITGQLKVEYNKNAEELSQKQQRCQVVHTRADSLKNLAERYEGYGNSIRRIMEQKSRMPGIHGVVADIMKVEKQYETAVETALGGSIQNVVTDTEQTAKKLIEYLKKNKYGRATFLPLDGIRVRGLFQQQNALKEPGVIGLASGLVHVAEEYHDLMEFLLGRVLVADNIDHALAVARKYQYSIRIVTLEGELLNAGGSMTGGAFKNSSSLLGRRREIEELETEEKKLGGQIRRLQERLKQLSSRMEESKRLSGQLQNRLQEIALQEAAIRVSRKQAEAKVEEIEAEKAGVMKEIGQMEAEIARINAECMDLEASIASIDANNTESESSVNQHYKALEAEEELRNKKAREVEALGLEYANLTQSYRFSLENSQRIEVELKRLSNEEDALQNSMSESRTNIEEKQQSITLMKQQVEQLEARKDKLEQEVQIFTRKREDITQRQKSFFVQREEISDRMSRLDKELFRLNDQRKKQEEHLDAQTDYLWNEYELSPSEAMELKQENFDNFNSIKRHISELKSHIRVLGNVNVNAIEDYKEVSQRYIFMKNQYDDLIKAETALVQVIDELDTGMRRQFEEKFQEIKREFNKVFQELFGGGQGTLELTEGEDVIEAGIRIISQPPGKKLQNMMQLSGGEKALTAISLLFAIQNLKPSPFCLLDEIEAALDDSNVGRFSNYLHKLTKSTQFIIITHRRGTMTSADRLYGITMQEKGVSTLVSVNLIQEALT